MPNRLTNRLDAVLGRILPEQRLFLRSDTGTRFIRIRPVTQLLSLGGGAVVLGWAVLASSVLAIDAVGGSSGSDRLGRDQAAFEQRLAELAAQRDDSAADAVAAQGRFAVAMEQLSAMQSQLLTSEQRRAELETGVAAVQANLQQALAERPDTLADVAAQEDRTAEVSVALDILSGELKNAASARVAAEGEAEHARAEAREVAAERDAIVASNDEILAQIESAVTVSVEPLDRMFKAVGMDPDTLLRSVEKGYSGQGGPLTPMGYSTRGNAAITEGETRATEIMISLDKVNRYRIAADKLPLAMPLKSAFRYTSPFGKRWGRMHQGVDMAGPVGTPVLTTGEGTVMFAGWQSGYGNVIKIQHALGVETRYGHLSKIHVKAGQKVSRGARIGDMGNTGRSTGPHLHYEVRVNGEAVDPLRFIKAAQNVF